MLAPRTLLLLGLAAPAAAFGVSARGLSPAKASVRSPAPQLVLGRVKSFVSNRIVSPFKKGSEEEDGEQKAAEVLAGESLIADAASLEIPPPMPALDKKNISAVDAFLVRLGVKTEDECTIPEEGEDLMEQIKCAGRAGIISYIIWEWAFWIGAGGIAAFTYFQVTGHWPDFGNDEDKAQVAASAFALVNVARFAVPLRIGLALSTTPWVDDNIVKPFLGGDDAEEA